jgi:hypothetical protein
MMSSIGCLQLPNWSAVARGIRTEYPNTGTGVLLPLTPENNYTAEVVIFGGQYETAWVNTTASQLALRIRVLYNETTGRYSFGRARSDRGNREPRSRTALRQIRWEPSHVDF